MKRIGLFLAIILIISPFLTFLVTDVEAASISESFDSISNFTQFQGTELSSGSLVISDDGYNLTEDFESSTVSTMPTGWTKAPASSSWEIQTDPDNSNKTLTYPLNIYDDATATLDTSSVLNGEIISSVKTLGGEQNIGLVFRYQDQNNYYRADLTSLYDGISITKVEDGVVTGLITKAKTLDINTYYTFRVVFNGSYIASYINGVKELEVVDSTFSDPGKVGLWRNGSGLRVDDYQVMSTTHDQGYAISAITSHGSNVQSVTLDSLTGTTLGDTQVLVSNNSGQIWEKISQGGTVYFKTSGSNFQYKIYLLADNSTPSIDSISFTTTEGQILSNTETLLNDLNKIHYTENGNSLYSGSMDPSYLNLEYKVPNTKMVQQANIVNINGDIVAYWGDSDNNTVDAYDLTNQVELWSTPLNGYIESTPYIEDGVLYIGSYEPRFFAINPTNGNILWSYSMHNAFSGSPINIYNGNAYFTDYGYNGTTRLYVVNTSNQTLTWEYLIPSITYASFTIDEDNNVLYLVSNNNIRAFEATTGTELWHTTTVGFITKQPSYYGDKLFVGADNELLVLDRFTGGTLWRHRIASTPETGIGGTPTIKDGIVYYATKSDQTLYARDIEDGSLVWSKSMGEGTFSTPVITTDDYIYLSFSSKMRVYDAANNGNLLWESPELSWAENNPSMGHGYLLFTDYNGTGNMNVYSVNSEDYSSADGITINRSSRNITSIKYNGMPSQDFDCNATSLFVNNNNSTVTIEYGDLPSEIISKPNDMIINPISNNGDTSIVTACNTSSPSDSFTYDFGVENISYILRDGQLLDPANYVINGTEVTITDSWSSHTYSVSNGEAPYLTPTQFSLNPNVSGVGITQDVTVNFLSTTEYVSGDQIAITFDSGGDFTLNNCTTPTDDADLDTILDGSASATVSDGPNNDRIIYNFNSSTTLASVSGIELCVSVSAPSLAGNYKVDFQDSYGQYYSVFYYVGSENQLNVIGTVDPVLTFSIRTSDDTQDLANIGDSSVGPNLCDLGNLSDTGVQECSYRLKVGTNAASGYSVNIITDGSLRKGTDFIQNISNATSVVSNSEGYGVAFASGSYDQDGVGTNYTSVSCTELGDFVNDDTPTAIDLGTGISSGIYSCAGPNNPDTNDTINTALVTHRAEAGSGTPAGTYTQLVTYTVSASF